jgi:hypothetical protein
MAALGEKMGNICAIVIDIAAAAKFSAKVALRIIRRT